MYHDSRDVLAGKTALFLLLRHKRFNHTITSAQTCNKICNPISGKKYLPSRSIICFSDLMLIIICYFLKKKNSQYESKLGKSEQK